MQGCNPWSVVKALGLNNRETSTQEAAPESQGLPPRRAPEPGLPPALRGPEPETPDPYPLSQTLQASKEPHIQDALLGTELDVENPHEKLQTFPSRA